MITFILIAVIALVLILLLGKKSDLAEIHERILAVALKAEGSVKAEIKKIADDLHTHI